MDLEPKKRNVDITLVLVGVAVGIILFLAPKTVTVTVVCLVALLALLTHPVAYLTVWLSNKKPRLIVGRIVIAEIVLLLAVLGFGRYVWPQSNQEARIQILYKNAEFNGHTIVSGGRQGVVNGLVIPTFQIKSAEGNQPITSLSVRLYLSEGGARWDGPWLPTESDDQKFPAEYYWGIQFPVSSGEPWNTPSFVAQRGRGEPWSHMVFGKMNVFYGISRPETVSFAICVESTSESCEK